jgi:predicted Zn-dependent protease
MKKLLIQGVVVILSFIGSWFALKQIDWVDVFRINRVADQTEQKLGDKFWEVFQQSEKEIQNVHVVNSVDSIVQAICKANSIDQDRLKIHILEKTDINAFALPNGHLVVYSGLILNSDNPEELAGVIGHEIAHIELNHVMKKLVKEIGLSSTAFDRGLEKDADMTAVDYLIKAKINPEPFANFLYKLSTTKSNSIEYFDWINTHPDSKERSEYIIQYSNGKSTDYLPILSADQWNRTKAEMENYSKSEKNHGF